MRRRAHCEPGRRRPSSRSVVTVALATALWLAGCGTTDEASRQTLPPLITTTSTSAPPTTAPDDATRVFYEIKRGDSLASIADSFDVPVSEIIRLNGIENPDTIPAGLTIEIPTGVVLVDDLPDPSGETTTSVES